MTSSPISDSVLVIEPGRTEKNYWADLWRYRELFIIPDLVNLSRKSTFFLDIQINRKANCRLRFEAIYRSV
jgi:hypothetical protein